MNDLQVKEIVILQENQKKNEKKYNRDVDMLKREV